MQPSDKHVQKYASFYQPGALLPEHHHRLVEGMPSFSKQANVPIPYIIYPATKFCGEKEIAICKKMRQHLSSGECGIVFTQGCEKVMERMSGLVGMFLRNFIDARVTMTHDVVEDLRGGFDIDVKVLALPNFFATKDKVQSNYVSLLMGFILDRYARGKFTLLYIEDMKALESVYGSVLSDHIEAHYLILGE